MTIRTYKVTLDTKNTIAPEPVYLRQGDKTGAVVIDATLMDNGAPVSLSGLTPSFMANTADGKAVVSDTTGFQIVDASGGKFTYQVPSQLGSADGKIKIAYFSFSDSSGVQSTFNVVFVVKKAVDMTQEHAKDWVSNLNEIIDQYNQWVNDAHSSWADFVDANKEIIESIDPSGTLLTEVIAARKPALEDGFPSLGARLDKMDELGLTRMYFPKTENWQEDCALLNLAGKWIIIDTGDDRDWDNIKSFILEHTDHIDIGIIGHYHRDHFGNAVNIINDIDIKTTGMTWYAPPMPTISNLDIVTDALTKLQVASANDSEKLIVVDTDLSIELDKLTTIQFFNSSTETYQHYYDANDTNYNDYSMVALIKYNSTSLLFAGDIMEGAINWITGHYQQFLYPVDFLKINHHGYDFDNSANFYTKIRPAVAIAMLTKQNYLQAVPGYKSRGLASTSINMLNNLSTEVSYAFKNACEYTIAQNGVVPVKSNNALRGTTDLAKISYFVSQTTEIPEMTDGSRNYPFCSLDEMMAHVQSMPNVSYELNILSGSYPTLNLHDIANNVIIWTEDAVTFENIKIQNCNNITFVTDIHTRSVTDRPVKIDYANVSFNAKLINDDNTADKSSINASRFLAATLSHVYVVELICNNRSCAAVANASAQISIFRASGSGNLYGVAAVLGSIYVHDLWSLEATTLRYEENGVISADVPWTTLPTMNGLVANSSEPIQFRVKGNNLEIRGSLNNPSQAVGVWTNVVQIPVIARPQDGKILRGVATSSNGVSTPAVLENGMLKIKPISEADSLGFNLRFPIF